MASIVTVFVFFILTALVVIISEAADQYYVTEGNAFEILKNYPVSVQNKDKTMQANSPAGTSYDVDIKLLGIIPIKDVAVQVVSSKMVVPGGEAFGIKLYTDGVMVVGISDIETPDQSACPARDAGIKEGDMIVSIDDIQVQSNEEVQQMVEKSGGTTLKILLKRDSQNKTVHLIPVRSAVDGNYKIGLWVRDSSAGIGTVTFYDIESGVFGGLGHGICDVDTEEIMPIMTGEAADVRISGIAKGVAGTPGELKGTFLANRAFGTLVMNNETGIYGITQIKDTEQPVPVALKQEIKTGKAQMISTLADNKKEFFDIEIEKIQLNENQETKNMIVKVTDPRLVEQTGGIVQGMSGSPIIQNGRLVGAVTHVFINDPQKGYAIFAENMLRSAKSVETKLYDKAS